MRYTATILLLYILPLFSVQAQSFSSSNEVIITREEIKRSGSKDLAQLLNSQTGIVVNNAYASPGSRKEVFVQGALGNQTLILLNGKPMQNFGGSFGRDNDIGFDLRLIPIQAVERIEISKGVKNTLHGNGASASVINIITTAGTPHLNEFTSSAYLGAYNTNSVHVGMQGGNQREGNYNITLTRNTSTGLDISQSSLFEERDNFEQTALLANFDIFASDNVTAHGTFNFFGYKSDIDAPFFIDTATDESGRTSHAGFKLSHNSDKNSMSSSYFFTDARTAGLYDTKFHNLEILDQYAFNKFLTLKTGFNYQVYIIESPGSNPNGTRETLQSSNPFGQLNFNNRKNFDVTFGYRWVINGFQRRFPNRSDNSFHHFSLNTSYSPIPGLNLRSSLANSFRFSGQSNTFLSGISEDGLFFDSGFDLELLNKKLVVNGTYYRRYLDSFVFISCAGCFGGIFEKIEDDDFGVELTSTYKLSENIQVSGFYNYTDGDYTISTPPFLTFNPPTRKDSTVFYQPRIPKHRVGGFLSFNISENLLFKAETIYSASRSDITFSRIFGPFAPNQVERLAPYTLTNVYSEYAIPNHGFTIFADIKNIFDQRFNERFEQNTLGFAFTAGIRYTFDRRES